MTLEHLNLEVTKYTVVIMKNVLAIISMITYDFIGKERKEMTKIWKAINTVWLIEDIDGFLKKTCSAI